MGYAFDLPVFYVLFYCSFHCLCLLNELMYLFVLEIDK